MIVAAVDHGRVRGRVRRAVPRRDHRRPVAVPPGPSSSPAEAGSSAGPLAPSASSPTAARSGRSRASDARRRRGRGRSARTPSAATCSIPRRSPTRSRGCSIVFHVAGVNAMCLRDPRADVSGRTSRARERGARRRRGRRRTGRPHLVGVGDRRGPGRRSDARTRRTGARTSRTTSARSTSPSAPRCDLAGELGVDWSCVNPSSVQGPGRTTGSARLLLDVVNGRLPVLVDTTISLVDIDDCADGPRAGRDPRSAGRAVRAERARASRRARRSTLLAAALGPARARPVRSRAGARAGGRRRSPRPCGGSCARDVPVCREAVRTLLHGHRYDGSRAERELGLRYTPIEETLRAHARVVRGARPGARRAPGTAGANVGWPGAPTRREEGRRDDARSSAPTATSRWSSSA